MRKRSHRQPTPRQIVKWYFFYLKKSIQSNSVSIIETSETVQMVNPPSEQVPATVVRDRGDVEGHPPDLCRLQVERRASQEGYRLRQDSRSRVFSRNGEKRQVVSFPALLSNVSSALPLNAASGRNASRNLIENTHLLERDQQCYHHPIKTSTFPA